MSTDRLSSCDSLVRGCGVMEGNPTGFVGHGGGDSKDAIRAKIEALSSKSV